MNTALPSPQSAPRPAPVLKRLLALGYDLFILAALSMAYWAVATLIMVNLLNVDTAKDYQPMSESLGFPLGWLATLIGFYWFFWKRAGQTIGMRAWRLKLIAVEGGSPSHQRILLRIALGPLSLLVFGLGYLWCFFNQKRMAWHDLASRTRVISLPLPHKK